MKTRPLLPFLIPGLLLFTGLAAAAADSAVVLTYHRFGQDRYPSTNIRMEQLAAQLKYLRDGGYTVVPLADLMASLAGKGSLPDRAVVFTIDDAYRTVYENGWPRFRELGFPITVFVATDPVDQGLRDYMTWDQMREMAEGGVTFANHGAAHESTLAKGGESTVDRLARVRADVEKGARRLAEELEPLSGVFAYPYGEYDTTSATLLQEMGYTSFGQQSGAVGPMSDRRALPRYPMAEAFAEMGPFRTKVASLPMPVTRVAPWDPATNETQPRIEVTLGPTDARLDELACFVGGQGKVEVEWLEERARFAVGAAKPLAKGRRRVNCTAPGKDGRYLWFSHPWFIRP